MRIEPRGHRLLQVDLSPQTQKAHGLLLLVREPSGTERAEMEKRGFVPLQVERKSLGEVVAEDPDYFLYGQLERLDLNPVLRDYTPPVAMEVFVKPGDGLFVPGSFLKDPSTQLTMMNKARVEEVKTINPAARAIMLPATGLAQLDKGYFAKTEKKLFVDRFGVALDSVIFGESVRVGRNSPDDRLRVSSWGSRNGLRSVGVVSAVVLLR